MSTRPLRLGTGAGFSADRLDPAVDLVAKGRLDAIVFECIGERTLAFGRRDRMADPEAGYNPLLERRLRAVLPLCRAHGTRLITNMGVAHPRAAATKAAQAARDLGLHGLRIAALEGDDVGALIGADTPLPDLGATVGAVGRPLVGANAYLGADAILPALEAGADVIITGRVADPSLFLAPLRHAFGWAADDWPKLGAGTLVGHLMECAAQITGGYFADPGFKDVPNLARLGFPIGDVREDGTVVMTKVPHAGGCVTEATCKEQLLYEIHDPQRYLQPDVVADFTEVSVKQSGADVIVSGGRGTARTATLKASVAYLDGFIGEGQISYGGPGALARARLALEIVCERLTLTGAAVRELRCDLIGVDSLYGSLPAAQHSEPYEVRVRVAARCDSREQAVRIGNEVETLYTNGPAGGGGVTKSVREVIAVQSVLLPREAVSPSIELFGN
jgi:hypothetical protein